jgi:hypothetical protein
MRPANGRVELQFDRGINWDVSVELEFDPTARALVVNSALKT